MDETHNEEETETKPGSGECFSLKKDHLSNKRVFNT